MKTIISICILLLLCGVAEAKKKHVLLYVDRAASADYETQIYNDCMSVHDDDALCQKNAHNAVPGTVRRKGVFPALKNALLKWEIIQDYQLIASQGSKSFWWCLIETSGAGDQISRIKEWVLQVNGCSGTNPISSTECTTAYADRVLWWAADNMRDAYRQMYLDRTEDSFILAILKRAMKYPVRANTGNPDHPNFTSVLDAEGAPYNLTIDWNQALPFRILAGEKW